MPNTVPLLSTMVRLNWPMSNSARCDAPTPARQIDAVGRDMREQRRDDRRRAGAFDHDVGRKLRQRVEIARVIGGAERAHELGLRSARVAVIDMHVEAALRAEQRGEQPDRAGAGDQHAARRRVVEPPDAIDMVPGLGDDAGRLQQHAR